MTTLTLSTNAQTKKYKTETFKVYGTCEMCEERIESTLDIVGVRFADWDKKTKQCKVIYKPSKISSEEIHQQLSNVGHSTSKLKADPDAYASLHNCCKYVEHNHKGCQGNGHEGCQGHKECKGHD